ncbi:MAG: branched-chain amino acid ABC transporter permease [Chitinophagales bacterium]|nr:branched-chain amino acid ABC transporter permease [Chitinophagales bacterium]
MEYILHLIILICFYTMLAQSLNLNAGFTGLISLAQAGFYGIGAYTSAILSVQYGFPFWFNLPVAMLLSFGVSYVVSLIALRTVDDYFIVCTLGIQVIIFSIMNNWMQVTKGPLGIPGIPAISFFGFEVSSKISFLLLSLALMLLVWLVLNNLVNSGFGKSLKAICEDEIYTQSIGKNVKQLKVLSFTISAVLASIPGALYAHYITYIDPTSFTVNESIFILSIVIIGGMGNLKGSFYASVFMILLPEVLRFVGISNSDSANYRQIIYGAILVLVMMRGNKNLFSFLQVQNPKVK